MTLYFSGGFSKCLKLRRMHCDSKLWIERVIVQLVYLSLASASSLRNRIDQNIFLARRFEKEIKEVLEVYSQDKDKKEQLLTGRRVHLAEELSMVFYYVGREIIIFQLSFLNRASSPDPREIGRIHQMSKRREVIQNELISSIVCTTFLLYTNCFPFSSRSLYVEGQ